MFSALATRALRAPTLARLSLLQRASVAAQLRAFTASAAALEPAKAAAAATTTTTSAKRAAAGAKGGRATAAKGALAAKPKAAAGATKAKATAPAKKPAAKKAAPKKAAPKPKKAAKPKPAPKPKVTEADKPPKRPLSAFLRFMAKYRAGAGPVTTAADVQEQAKAGGAVWRAMSEHEQQAFKDEYTGALPAYAAAFAAWSAGVDPAKLRLLNAKRRARGKSAVRRAPGAGAHPATPYMRFLAQRPKLSYPPGADTAQRRAAFAEFSRANGAAWTALSDADKKPYRDAYEKDSVAYRAEQAALETASSSA